MATIRKYGSCVLGLMNKLSNVYSCDGIFVHITTFFGYLRVLKLSNTACNPVAELVLICFFLKGQSM